MNKPTKKQKRAAKKRRSENHAKRVAENSRAAKKREVPTQTPREYLDEMWKLIRSPISQGREVFMCYEGKLTGQQRAEFIAEVNRMAQVSDVQIHLYCGSGDAR